MNPKMPQYWLSSQHFLATENKRVLQAQSPTREIPDEPHEPEIRPDLRPEPMPELAPEIPDIPSPEIVPDRSQPEISPSPEF